MTTFAQEVARFNTQNNDAYRLAIVGFASESGNGDNTEILTVYGTEEITNIEYRKVDDITTLDTSKTYYIADGDGYTSISYYEASSSIFGSYQAGWYTSGFFAFRGDYVNIQSTTVYERITTTTSAAATTPGIPYNSLTDADYQAALVNCTDAAIDATGTIGKAIAELDANGATRTDLGMQMAASIFASQPAGTYTNRQKIVDTFTDVKGHWAEAEIHEAAAHGWIKGYEENTFKPDQFISRAEAFTMINRVLNRIPETTTDLHSDMVKWPDNANTSSWFYIAVQEATNSHKYNMKNRIYEKWTSVEKSTDWTQYQ